MLLSKKQPKQIFDQPLECDILTDLELTRHILNGDKEVFEQLVVRYQRQLFVYLIRLLNNNEEDAKDCLSETFVKAYQNLVLFNPSLSFNSWIYRIAHNTAVDLIRKKCNYYTINYENLALTNIAINEDNPRKEDLELILSFLTVSDRNLITLYYLQELSLNEISDILKIKPNTISVQLKRAREKAKKIIQSKL